MANKKDATIEEMTTEMMKQQLTEAQKRVDELREQLQKAEQEEESRKKAELALEKEARKKEVDEAIKNTKELLSAYTKDYGDYSYVSKLDDYGLFSKRPISWWF